MAFKNFFTVTAVRIVTPQGKTSNFPSGTDVSVAMNSDAIFYPVASLYGSGTDTLIVMADGTKIWTQQEIADIRTALSATSSTGS